jgi:hypothetical protein
MLTNGEVMSSGKQRWELRINGGLETRRVSSPRCVFLFFVISRRDDGRQGLETDTSRAPSTPLPSPSHSVTPATTPPLIVFMYYTSDLYWCVFLFLLLMMTNDYFIDKLQHVNYRAKTTTARAQDVLRLEPWYVFYFYLNYY